MSKHNINRTGYKKTKVGWIPKEWETTPLGEVANILFSNVDKKIKDTEINVFLCNYTDVYNNEYITSNIEFMQATASSREIEKYGLRYGDIIITKDSETKDDIAVSALVTEELTNIVCGYHLAIIRPLENNRLSGEYLNKLFDAQIMRHYFARLANGVTRYGLTSNAVNNALIPFPPFSEQEKIAEILSTWNEAIEQTRMLIGAKKRRKKALMQQLLTGKKRLPGFGMPVSECSQLPEGWRKVGLNKAFERIQRTTTPDVTDILSITATVGFVHQRDKFSRVIAGQNLKRYILLLKGEFAYNKGNSKSYPQGCVYMLVDYEEAAVPNVYYCFRPKTSLAHGDFYKYYFENGSLNQKLQRVINTGVRNDGLLNLYQKDFFEIKIVVPPIDEQRRIAEILSAADDEINALKTKLEALEKQRRGLMQKLLTGEVRVR